jgi:hypothetical protein
MATYTLAQRYLIRNNLALGATPESEVTLFQKVNESCYKIGADILNEQLLITTTMNSGVPFTLQSKGVTEIQLALFGLMAINGQVQFRLVSLAMDEPSFILADTDAKIINVVKRSFWGVAKQLGKGII